MNVALLLKWIWKLANNVSWLWPKILKARYFPCRTFFEASARGSSFWNGLQAMKPAFALGARFLPHDRKSIRFWHDSWLDKNTLLSNHRSLFIATTNPDITVAKVCSVSSPAIWFRQALLPAEMHEWDSSRARISSIALDTARDEVTWKLSASGQFSVKSMYDKLSQSPVLDMALGLWKAALPLKVKIFLWQMFRKLPSIFC